MERSEAEEIFRELSSWLQENGYDWLVTKIQRTIERGKKVEKKAKQHKKTEEGEYKPSSQPSSYTGRADYTPVEQLSLLIDAIERTIVDGAHINYEVVAYFQREGEYEEKAHDEDVREPMEVVLASPLDESEAGDIQLDVERERERLDSARDLKSLLDDLRERL